jgi:hypothetical protein
MLRTDAVTKKLDTAAGARALHFRRFEPTAASKLLGDRRREGVDGRGADDVDEIASRLSLDGRGTRNREQSREGQPEFGGACSVIHECHILSVV